MWRQKNVNNVTMDNFCHHPPSRRNCKRDKREEICFGHYGRNDKRILWIDASINNQQFCVIIYKERWCIKQSKHKSKGSYWHYQRRLSTQIIDRPDHPRYHLSSNSADWLENSGELCVKWRYFAWAPYNSLKRFCHIHIVQPCACFLDSCGRTLAWNRWDQSTVRQHFNWVHQVDFPSSNWWQYHQFTKQYWEPRYYKSNRALSFLSGFGKPNHWTLSLMEFAPKTGVLRPF